MKTVKTVRTIANIKVQIDPALNAPVESKAFVKKLQDANDHINKVGMPKLSDCIAKSQTD